MKRFVILVVLFSGFIANAGIFGASEPPQDFLNYEVQSKTGTTTNLYGFSVAQLAKMYKDNAKLKWERDGSSWILKIDRKDKMTSEMLAIAILLSPTSDKKANISRMTMGTDTVPDDAIFRMMSQTAIAFNRTNPAKNAQPASSKTNSTFPETAIQDPKSSDLRPLNFNLKKLTEYFIFLGAEVEWTSAKGEFGTEIPTLKITNSKGISSIQFKESGCFKYESGSPQAMDCLEIKTVKGGKTSDLIKSVSSWMNK